ncbi:hypothetical protein QBC47DRAFT_439960 [Echria macrotheca]|uniref:Uncharacterized protein n=1 Tax=Echria macrotheca TaxID=438768 RepID=A0AAJ0F666_9PEZI|nr:hypothetical protein QBC47DRAFT_439960 [Echria macrotheca]
MRGELGTHESAILACLHLLSHPQARGQILSIKPDAADRDVFFEARLDVYLQLIIHSRRANPGVCSEDEITAAKELLDVLKGRSKDFPSILGLLRAVGHGTCQEALPVSLIERVLKLSHYQANLTRELDSLRRARHWFDAYKLVCGLRDIVSLPMADRLLVDMFPDYPMWAAWRPDFRRILSWESPNISPYRSRLGPVLDLEGPDTTGQQRGTLRMSSPGAFAHLVMPAGSEDRDVLDRLLEMLDSCLLVGPHTIDLFTELCLENRQPWPESLMQLKAAIQLNDNMVSKTLG